MQQNKLYEYAVIRIVPRVEREEFINAGIVLFCKKEKYLNCKYELNEEKLLCLYAEADIEFIRQNLQSFPPSLARLLRTMYTLLMSSGRCADQG